MFTHPPHSFFTMHCMPRRGGGGLFVACCAQLHWCNASFNEDFSGCYPPHRVPPAWCNVRCDVNPVHTQIMVILNSASKWAGDSEHNDRVMLIVCMGKTFFKGIILGSIGHNGCMHGNKSFTLQCVVSLRLGSSHVTEFGRVRATQWYVPSGHYGWACARHHCGPIMRSSTPYYVAFNMICLVISSCICICIAHQTTSCFPSCAPSPPWAVRGVAPFLSQGYNLLGRGCGQLQPSTP